MRHQSFTALFIPIVFLATLAPTLAQDLPPQPKEGAKVCVAIVGNASTQPALVERLTERLTKSLKSNNVRAVTMDSRTTTNRDLRPTEENGSESRESGCDYILLTQISATHNSLIDPHGSTVSIGRPAPDIDASNPDMRRNPFGRDIAQMNFSLFRNGRFKPVLDSHLPAQSSENVADSFLLLMDRVANRVAHEVKK
jgi:hypothetical protein